MFHRNILLRPKVRYRPCYLQDTVMRASAQPLLLHRPFQQPLRIRRQLTVSPNLLGIHLSISKDLPRSRLRRPPPLRPLRSPCRPKPRMLPLSRRASTCSRICSDPSAAASCSRNSLYCTAVEPQYEYRSDPATAHSPFDNIPPNPPPRRAHTLPRFIVEVLPHGQG